MVVRKRRKYTRLLGSRTYGWGKQHRGKGQKGGSGRSGGGKKAHCKKPMFRKEEMHFGKRGFKKKGVILKFTPISLRDIAGKLAEWISRKLVTEENGAIVIDLPKLGYNKLLGSGAAIKQLKITVPFASAKAAKKVQDSGGEVTGLGK